MSFFAAPVHLLLHLLLLLIVCLCRFWHIHDCIFEHRRYIYISRVRRFIHVIPRSYTSHLFWIILNGLCGEKNLCVCVIFSPFFVFCYCWFCWDWGSPHVHLTLFLYSRTPCLHCNLSKAPKLTCNNNNNSNKNESHFKFSTNVSLYLKWALVLFHRNLLLTT